MVLLFLLLLNSCGLEKEKAKETASNPLDLFDLQLSLIQELDRTYHLVADLKLKQPAYVVSSYSADTLYSPFEIIFPDNSVLNWAKKPLESPESVVEYDSIIGAHVHLIRNQTFFTSRLFPLTDQDFKIEGWVEFVLEPLCIPYKLKFIIIQNDQNLKLQSGKIETNY